MIAKNNIIQMEIDVLGEMRDSLLNNILPKSGMEKVENLLKIKDEIFEKKNHLRHEISNLSEKELDLFESRTLIKDIFLRSIILK